MKPGGWPVASLPEHVLLGKFDHSVSLGAWAITRNSKGLPAPEELEHDPETGEVGPRAVERGDNEPWRDWCARLLVHIRKEEELEPIDEWVKANQAAITALL
jgi:hypothetical protein